MRKILTPMQPIFSNDGTTAVWNPLTPAIPARDIACGKFAIWLGGLANLKCKPAWQFSDDGVSWSDTPASAYIKVATEWATADGWTYGDSSTWQWIVASGSTKSFVRFGVLALNTGGSTTMQYASARLEVRPQAIFPGSRAVRPRRVWTKNDEDFIPLTGPIAADGVDSVRAELELRGVGSTSISVRAAWQDANYQGATWSTPTGVGSTFTTDSFNAAGDYTSVSSTKRLVRLGVLVTQASGTDVRSCIVRARFDWR